MGFATERFLHDRPAVDWQVVVAEGLTPRDPDDIAGTKITESGAKPSVRRVFGEVSHQSRALGHDLLFRSRKSKVSIDTYVHYSKFAAPVKQINATF
jgi:hypothetical protein